MSFVTGLRKSVDKIRAIPGVLGLHQYAVTRITRVYSGGTVGHGAYADTSEVLRVNGQNIHARRATQGEIDQLFGQGTFWTEGQWIVGPMTPAFSGGGYDPDSFDAASSSTATVILYSIVGEGVAGENLLYRAIRKTTDKPFSITLLLEQTNAKA